MMKCEITYFILSEQHQGNNMGGQLKIREGEETEAMADPFLTENRNQSGIMEWFGLDGILNSFSSNPCLVGTLFPFPEGPLLALLSSKTIFKASHLPVSSMQH